MRRGRPALLLLLWWSLSQATLSGQQQPQEVTFLSQGDQIHALLFRGHGEGPNPTIVLFHGFPGGEGDVFGLGALLSEDGWNVLAVNFRGMFRNGGLHTPSNTLADGVAALDFLEQSGLDSMAQGRFSVVGYSYGGWVALYTGATDPRVSCIVGIGPGNLGVIAQDILRNPENRQNWEGYLESVTRGDPARGIGGVGTVEEILRHAQDFDLTNHGPGLSTKPLLLLAGWRDSTASLEGFILPISRAIEAVDGTNLTPVVLDDDHAFASTRDQLRAAVQLWFAETCRPALSR
jgi:pimeloyl-ACP methyl ester carboxylesterase